MSDEEEEYARRLEAITESENAMESALQLEFAAAGLDDTCIVLDYVAVAEVLDADGNIGVRFTRRNDSKPTNSLGLLTYGIEAIKHRMRSGWAGE